VSAIGDTPAFDELIDPAEELVQIGSGYEFGEGPVWDPVDGCLLFCDLPGDTRWRWTEERGMEVAMRPAFKAGGLSMDPDGNLVACEHVGSSVTRYTRDGRREVIAYHARGEYLNSPNDIVVRSDGSVYFTDPDYGRWNDWIGCKREPLLGYTAVFRVPHEGGPAELCTEPGEFEQPNGLCFSPDESLMYVNDSPRAHIKVFEVGDDGKFHNGRVLAEGIGGTIQGGSPDGMECDEFGNVWTTGPGGVWVFDPNSGERIGLIETPETCGSLCWGGPDLRTLFLTTSTTLHSMPTLCTSAPLPHY